MIAVDPVHLSFPSFRSKNSLIFFLIEIEFGKELKREILLNSIKTLCPFENIKTVIRVIK